MRLRPLHDWVLIRRDEPERETSGGIIIPDSARNKPSGGIVEAIGPGRFRRGSEKRGEKFVPTVLKPGQRVFFSDYAGRDIELGDEKVTLVREEDILGTFESEGEVSKKPGLPHPAESKQEAVVGKKTGVLTPAAARRKKQAKVTAAATKSLPEKRKKAGKAHKIADTKRPAASPEKKGARKVATVAKSPTKRPLKRTQVEATTGKIATKKKVAVKLAPKTVPKKGDRKKTAGAVKKAAKK